MAHTHPSFYAHVAIIRRTYSGAKTHYTYKIPSEASFGDLVRIPFGKKIALGVITNITKKAPQAFTCKSIIQTLEKKAITQEQYLLAQYLSEEYVATPYQSLSHFLPPKATKKTIPLPSLKGEIPPLTLQEKTVQKSISETFENTTFVHPFREKRFLTLIEGLQKRKPQKQIFILFPDRASLVFFEDIFEQYGIVSFHGSLSPSKKYSIWKHISDGKPLILAGTKSALFLPFRNLDCVVIEEEFRSSYKNIQTKPYYDIRRIARQLASLHQSFFLISTPRMSFEYTHLAQKNKWKSLTATPRLRQPIMEDLRLPTYKKKTKKKYAKEKTLILTPLLLESIRKSFSQKAPFLLLSPRRGMQGLSRCKKCHTPLWCEQCKQALILQKDQSYICPQCQNKKDIFTSCPVCGSLEFQTSFPGSQAIEKALEEYFPTKNIVRIDADTYKKGDQALKERNETIIRSDVVIGTPHTIYTWPSATPSGIGIVEADVFWQWSDYLSEESTYFLFAYARFLASQKNAPYIIQTFQEHHRILQSLTSNKKELHFLQETLDERSALSYPPFSRAILLSLKEISTKNTVLAENTYLLLKKTFPSKTIISKPYIPPQKRSQTLPSHILIRFQGKYDADLPQKWKTLAKKLSLSWNIDIDPRDIF